MTRIKSFIKCIVLVALTNRITVALFWSTKLEVFFLTIPLRNSKIPYRTSHCLLRQQPQTGFQTKTCSDDRPLGSVAEERPPPSSFLALPEAICDLNFILPLRKTFLHKIFIPISQAPSLRNLRQSNVVTSPPQTPCRDK